MEGPRLGADGVRPQAVPNGLHGRQISRRSRPSVTPNGRGPEERVAEGGAPPRVCSADVGLASARDAAGPLGNVNGTRANHRLRRQVEAPRGGNGELLVRRHAARRPRTKRAVRGDATGEAQGGPARGAATT